MPKTIIDTGLLLKLFHRAGVALATGLTYNLDKTTRLVQVSPVFAGQILFLLIYPQQPCKLPAKQLAGFESTDMETYHCAKPFIKSSCDKSIRTCKMGIVFLSILFSIPMDWLNWLSSQGRPTFKC